MEWLELIPPILGLLAIFGVLAFMIYMAIADEKYVKEQKAKQAEKPEPKPKKDKFHAKVVKMECATRHVGIKQPKLIKEFLVFFEDDEGKAIRLFVDEEYYLSMEVGQVGNLTLIDGELYSFVLDE